MINICKIVDTVKDVFAVLRRCLAAKPSQDLPKEHPSGGDKTVIINFGGTVINGPVTFNLIRVDSVSYIQKFDTQLLQCSAPVTVFESPTAIEPYKLWLCCRNQNIMCGAYFLCETGGAAVRFWLGLIFSENEAQSGLYLRIPASEVKDHSERKTVCGIKAAGNEYRIPVAPLSGKPNEQDIQQWLTALEEKSGLILRDIGAA